MQSFLTKIVQLFEKYDAFRYSVIVAETAASSAGEQFLAPYAAAAVGEYFMEHGKDVLVVFDDLSKHAWIYRQISLLIGRAPGREAYPGDMFFIHSQLLERAARLRPEAGGGTMTFLPIVETQQGDLTNHIPSNLISITDGQVYLSSSLFNEGFKPAIDIGLSVSRIGNKVQPPALKEVSRTLRYEYTQQAELVKLTRLKSSLSTELQQRLRRGQALKTLLMQAKSSPSSFEEEVLLFYAFQSKLLEGLTDNGLQAFIEKMYPFLLKKKRAVVDRLIREKNLSAELKQEIDRAFEEFIEREGIEKGES
jgi:F-type H+-transporting ATPase subunit alpha